MGGIDSKIYSLFKGNLKIMKMPVVVILGATGTGKSQLAIELAKVFNGEIISADSMQVYKGLDIVTNKVTIDEQSGVKHHCLSYIEPLSRYTVVDFRNEALPIINNLLEINKLPIIVGGTNYYIESLLWDVLVSPSEKRDTSKDQLLYDVDTHEDDYAADLTLLTNESNIETLKKNLFSININQISCENVPSDILHKLLNEVDPVTASTLHPNDKRKIIRSLQVYQQHQSRLSDILQMQRSQKGGSTLGGPLRYKNSIMFWIQCEKSVLDKRLDERVDKMIEKNLVEELLQFHANYNKERLKKNLKYTEGIFQSIGFKEFHDYLILSEEEKQSDQGLKLYEAGINNMKLRTRQYATKQKKWIVNRFLRNYERDRIPVYSLDGSDLSCWKENVFNVALNVVECIIQGTKPNISPFNIEKRLPNIPESHYCDICDKTIIGRETWRIHITSRKHEKMKKRKNKQHLKHIS